MRRIVVAVLAVLVVGLMGLAGYARWSMDRSYAGVAEPRITANRSPEAVARGELIFHSLCIECHAGPAGGTASGKRLDEVPAFLGTFYSANLTLHERTDGQLARVLRNGVLPDGRLSVVMNGFGAMGDDDIAALLGYFRSRPAVLEKSGEEQPHTRISWTGAAILTYVAGVDVVRPAQGVTVPPKAPNVEYGRYMAKLLDCGGCHTEGFGANKAEEPGAFAGGFELTDPTGVPIYTRNITPDAETGIGAWSVDQFERAVTRGVRPDETLVRKPMPLFARLDRVDVEALYAFLKTVPAVKRANQPGGHAIERAAPSDGPEQLFVKTGCVACHGPSGPFRDKLRGAVGKSDAQLTEWILEPQATRPGSPMPAFRGVLERPQAEALARYVRELATSQQ